MASTTLSLPNPMETPHPKKNYTHINNINKFVVVYNKADILYVSNDPTERTIIENYFFKYLIKTNEDDKGRRLKIEIAKSSNELFREVLKNHHTYGTIIINQKLGPDNYNGCECIQHLRKCGYKGSIALVVNDPPRNFKKYEQCGVNTILTRKENIISKEFLKNICDLLSKVTIRNLDL